MFADITSCRKLMFAEVSSRSRTEIMSVLRATAVFFLERVYIIWRSERCLSRGRDFTMWTLRQL